MAGLRRWRLAVALAAAAAIMPAEASAQEGSSFGLGVGLRSLVVDGEGIGILSYLAPQFYLVLGATDRVILEPSIGVFRRAFDTGDGPFTSEGSTTVLRLGTGVYFASPAGDRGRIYYGPQVGIVRLSSEVTFRDFDGVSESDSQSRTDLVLAAVTGGEFFLVDRLGVGGEVGLTYTIQGDEEDEDDDDSASFLATTAEIKVRWYLGGRR